jgi:hypothetical protein
MILFGCHLHNYKCYENSEYTVRKSTVNNTGYLDIGSLSYNSDALRVEQSTNFQVDPEIKYSVFAIISRTINDTQILNTPMERVHSITSNTWISEFSTWW